MAISADDYGRQLQALLPPGPAWEADLDPFHEQLLGTGGVGLAGVHGRADDLMRESDPRTTYELLARWESVLGLPDECTLPGATLAERRAAVVAKFLAQGGMSRSYYIGVAEGLGYPGATITEFRPMTCESACDAGLDPDPWSSVWILNLPGGERRRDMEAESDCDEALSTWGDTTVECVVSKQAPAHTILHFAYGDA